LPKSWQPGETPWARANPDQMPCPYCGERKLIISMMDIQDDDLRVELYCDNEYCEARSFATILMSHHGMRRADTQALFAVDHGDDPEEENLLSSESMQRMLDRPVKALERRRQASEITVRPRQRQ
jgi:hypothetical protein